MLDVVRTRDEHTVIGHLGPDLLGETVDVDEALRRWAARGSTPVAEVLLDQTVVAGIGTIFSAESLFAERLWPWTPADAIADPARLLAVARRQLQRSVADGRPPERVHGRLRQPCHRCGTRIAVGQARKPPMERPIFYCPRCQQEPAERVSRRTWQRSADRSPRTVQEDERTSLSVVTGAGQRPVDRDGEAPSGSIRGRPRPSDQPMAASSDRDRAHPKSEAPATDAARSAGTVSGISRPSATATRSLTSRRTSDIGTSSASQMLLSSSDDASF